MTQTNLETRIKKYISYTENDCWEWQGAKSKNNAVIHYNKKNLSVKRFLFFKDNPNLNNEGYLHSLCKNKLCVNPRHFINRDQYIWSLIEKNDNGCWIWNGIIKNQYPYISINHKDIAVHRYMYELHKGKIPKNHNVCHSCDVPKCVNPEHLWVGTQIQNIQDMINKKRDYKIRGEKHHKAKVSLDQVIQIKKLLNKNMPMTKIQKELNISYKTIQHIKHGTSWSHVNVL